MALLKIECQLTQGQMSRYLAGESMPEESVSELKAHIESCPQCRESMRRRKEVLQSIVGGTQPVEDQPRATEYYEPVDAREALLHILKKKTSGTPTVANVPTSAVASMPESEQTRPTINLSLKHWKPLAYSLGLAAVLIAMSLIARNPTSVLGERALTAGDAKPTAKSAPIEASKASQVIAQNAPTVEDQHREIPEATNTANPGTNPTTVAPAIQPKSPDKQYRSASNESKSTNTEPNLVRKPNPPTTAVRSVPGSRTTGTRPKPARTPGRKSNVVRGSSRVSPRRTLPRAPKSKAPARKGGGGIKVYDESGQPIGG